MTWGELTGEVGAGEGAHTMHVADEDDLSDHEGNAVGVSFTSPGERIGLGFGFGLGSPPGGYPGFGNQSVEGQSPFDDLNELMVHHAHLAVFLNYVISNSDPAALVSTMKWL